MKFFPRIFSLALSAVVVLTAASATAAPIVINDQIDSSATHLGADYGAYSSANFANRVAGGKHWGDELSSAGHPFDTTSITVDRNDSANAITFTMHTMFNGNDQGAAYADLFFDIATPAAVDGFGYAIALGAQNMAAGLYTVGSASTSNDIWGGRGDYVYGGYAQFATSAPGFDPGMALAVPVRLDSGTAISGVTVSVSQVAVAGGFFDLSVLLQGVDLSLFNNFDLLWGTGDCGNDAIWGTLAFAPPTGAPVDAPPALGLLVLGLLGCFGLRRQRAAAQSA